MAVLEPVDSSRPRFVLIFTEKIRVRPSFWPEERVTWVRYSPVARVSEVYSITGDHDLVAMVRVHRHEELAEVIPGRLNKIDGVVHTDTHIAFRTYSRHDLDAVFSLGLPED